MNKYRGTEIGVLLFLTVIRKTLACTGLITEGWCIEIQSTTDRYDWHTAERLCSAKGQSMLSFFTEQMFYEINNWIIAENQAGRVPQEKPGVRLHVWLGSWTTHMHHPDISYWNRLRSEPPVFMIGDMYLPLYLPTGWELGKDKHCLSMDYDLAAGWNITRVYRDGCGVAADDSLDFWKFATHCMYAVDPVAARWETNNRDNFTCADYEVTPGYYLQYSVAMKKEVNIPDVPNIDSCAWMCKETPYCKSFNYWTNSTICNLFGIKDKDTPYADLLTDLSGNYGEITYNV